MRVRGRPVGRAHGGFNLSQERRELRLEHIPDDSIVNIGVAVDQDVAERNDALVLVDPGSGGRIVRREATERFADDLELPLGCRTEQRVGLVIDEDFPLPNCSRLLAAWRMSYRYFLVSSRI